MAKFQIYDAAPDYQSWADLPAPRQTSRITDGTSNTIFAFELADTGKYAGWKMTCEGTGFTWLANKDGVVEPISGRINRFELTDGLSNTIFVAEQFLDAQRPEISDVYNLMFDGAGDWSRSMWDLLTSITNYADTINGSAHGDAIFSGRNLGNDSIFGFKGNDIVRGNAGTDYYDGGDDYDTLTFVDSFTDYTAYRGINLNAATGKVIDCWGNTDSFDNFEYFGGSRLRDTMRGSDWDGEIFRGYRGGDWIDGGGGLRDWVRYDQDAQFGGLRGIKCDLDDGSHPNGLIRGRIVDGFGNTDTVFGIERVMGTAYDDRFEGSDGDNMFCGLEGKDSFIGRGGFDSINFADGSVRFIRVNLSRGDGQIIDDGFGNTEFAVGIEEVIGTAFTDNIQGNFADNRLVGGGDVDTLKGNAGIDTFAYEAVGDFGDTILDFLSGTDKLEFNGAGIGLTPVFNFVADEAGISNGNSAFFLSGQTLMLDLDGTGLQAAVAVLTIQAGGTITAGDIFVV